VLKKIAIGVVVLVLIILGIAATKPDTFSMERSATINAPPEKIYSLIHDYHKWGAWSPWEKLDPNMRRTFTGADSGVGAIYSWEGNSDVGSGKMEIIDTTMPTKVEMALDFLSPMEAHNTTTFNLTPAGGATNVTWTMTGENNYLSKIMSVFISMDKMIGPDFERGLANLKTEAEK
jgi:uncharacterized protein YndB with AHSA1/START domain